jgi:hypothetical protein
MSDFPEMEYAIGDAELELAPDEASLDFLQKVCAVNECRD